MYVPLSTVKGTTSRKIIAFAIWNFENRGIRWHRGRERSIPRMPLCRYTRTHGTGITLIDPTKHSRLAT